MPDFLKPIWSFMQKIDRFIKDTWASVYDYGLYVRSWFAPKPDGFKEILNRIRTNDPELTHLDLSDRGLSYWNIIELCYALAVNTTLKSLDLSQNRIGATGAQALAANNTLTSLDLSENRIDDVGAQFLAANTTLKSLDLSENRIKAPGAQALAANNTLKSLDLSMNRIGATGAQALAANNTLTSLKVSHCRIGNAGAQFLAVNNTLKSLHVCDNQIDAAGAQALAANNTLTSLNVSANGIGVVGAQAFAANTTLISLDVGGNQISRDLVILLWNSITRNKQLMIDTKKAILGLYAFSSIATSVRGALYLPTDIAHHIGSFLTGHGDKNTRRLNEIDQRASERAARHAFFPPAVMPVPNMDDQIQPVPNVYKVFRRSFCSYA